MFTRIRSFEVDQSYDKLVATMQEATDHEHPLPVVSIDNHEDNATFSVAQKIISHHKMIMSGASGSLKRLSKKSTQVEMAVNLYATPGLLFAAFQVVVMALVYVMAQGEFDPVVLNFLVIASMGVIIYDRVRYTRQFRAQMTALFGDAWH
jgi:hypothetical protein